MRRLLIISAEFTGHGHKSISDSLMERLAIYKDLEVRTIDGFDLMTRIEKVCAEKTYGPITRLPGKAWEMNYAAGMRFKKPLQRVIVALIRNKFEKLIEEFKPDCILSVHPIFLGSVLDILEDMNLHIPFVAHEADLIDIALQWFDPRIDLVLAPSQEAYDCTVEHGVAPARVRKVGFPVRSRFMGLTERAAKKTHDGLVVTIMSGSEGSGMIRAVAREILHGTDASVNVVCGRNKALRKKLRKAVTDCDGIVKYDIANKAGVSNLLAIYTSFTGKTMQEAEEHFAGQNYGALKNETADAVIEGLAPIQAEYARLMANRDYLHEIMRDGALRAGEAAAKTVKKVYAAMGFNA